MPHGIELKAPAMTYKEITVSSLLRIGSAAKGLVYFLMGLFCLGTVVNISTGTSGPEETIAWLGRNPYGQVVYFVLGTGILCYAAWRLYEAFLDPFARGKSFAALFYRLNCIIVGICYGALAVYSFRRLFRFYDGGEIRKDALQLVLQLPYGAAITYIIAVAVVGAGISALYTGFSNAHMRDVDNWALTRVQRKGFEIVGAVGLGGVAAVYFIMAYSLYRVAQMNYADNFMGVGDSLAYLEGWSVGLMLMLITGVGLLAYGIFMFLLAYYERRPEL